MSEFEGENLLRQGYLIYSIRGWSTGAIEGPENDVFRMELLVVGFDIVDSLRLSCGDDYRCDWDSLTNVWQAAGTKGEPSPVLQYGTLEHLIPKSRVEAGEIANLSVIPSIGDELKFAFELRPVVE